MPSFASLHPQVVHFAIALLLVGVLFRVASLMLAAKWTWLNGAATSLLILGTTAAVVAVKTGTDAHGPIERIPGARSAVEEHQEWGQRTRNIFLVVSALELVGLALGSTRRRIAFALSAVVGIGGSLALYEAGEHGSEIVYGHAGGVGTRSGDPGDVNNLLLAGLYQQAMLDRKNGKGTDAYSLIDMLKSRYPNDTAVRLLWIESTLRDRKDPSATLAALDSFTVDSTDRRLRTSTATLRADALIAAGRREDARAVLERLLKAFPGNPRLQAKLDSLK
ncbi:MAG: tetratricopeptide repeat protein [Gemmatimonadaceae bacterium]